MGSRWLWSFVVAVVMLQRASAVPCSTNLRSVANFTIFSPDALKCTESPFPYTSADKFAYWALKDNTTGFVSIVLAAPLVSEQYAAFGFSEPGQMVGSTAVVTTLSVVGVPVVTQYFLGAKVESQVVKDDTRLALTQSVQAFYNATSKTVYVGLQVNFAASKAVPNFVIYAQGPASGDGSTISYHRESNIDKLADSQFPVGAVGESEASKQSKQIKAHGAIQVFGWGVLLPIGAMVARYARGFDPAWFYIHVTFQIIGFVFVLAGVATGVNLAKTIRTPGLDGHRGLGIFLLTLAILQVLAVVLRPKKDASIRRYWNWYHWWVGRLALFLAVINIFVGLNLGNEERKLKVSYIVLLAFELLAFAILETIYWLRWNRDPGTGNRWNRSSTEREFQLSDNY